MSDPTPVKFYSLEAEASLIGGILIAPERLPGLRNAITSEMFYRSDYRLIWAAIIALADEDQAIDLVTVMERLERDGHLPERVDMPSIVALVQDTPSASNVSYYAKIVIGHARRRKLQALSELVPMWTASIEDPDAVATKIREYMDSASIDDGNSGPQTLGACMTSTLALLDERAQRPPGLTGLPTGLQALDELLDGLCPGRLYVVAGRPGMGKSILGLQFARHAVHAGSSAGVWTLEMPYDEYVTRLWAAERDIPYRKIQMAQLDPGEWGALADVVQKMNDAQMWIDDTEALNITELLSRARTLHRLHGLGLIVVDYLGLMHGDRKLTREREVAVIVMALKSLAKKLKIPVVLLAQLNRTLESRSDKRPILSDLRESGGVEQDADVVLMLYRDEIYNDQTPDKGCVEIIIRKQRAGALGMVPGKFLGALSRIEPLAILPSQANIAGAKSYWP